MLRLGVVLPLSLALALPLARAQEDESPEPDDTESTAADAREDKAAEAAEAPKAPRARLDLGWLPTLSGTARAGAGALEGDSTTPGRGAMSVLGLSLTGGLDRGRFSLEAPVDVSHRQTFGAHLDETRAKGALRAQVTFTPRLRLAAELGVGIVRRPDWRDHYQPQPDGTLGLTDRFSRWDRKGLVELVARPWRHERLRIRYDYRLLVYQQDPAFDPLYDPNHLTPWDKDVHRIDAVWRHRGDGWKLRLGAELSRTAYFYEFARDAGTGTTHAGAGGEPANPLLELREVKPRVETEVELFDAMVVLGVGYELELQEDSWQGYQSWVGHHPELSVSVALPRDVELEAHAEAFLRTYGSGGYMVGAEHPALLWGDRRVDRLLNVDLTLKVPLAGRWTALAQGAYHGRRTNYPPYVPGVYPDTREYDVDWDYDNWSAWGGIEARF